MSTQMGRQTCLFRMFPPTSPNPLALPEVGFMRWLCDAVQPLAQIIDWDMWFLSLAVESIVRICKMPMVYRTLRHDHK